MRQDKTPVDANLVELALEKCDYIAFEKFSNTVYGNLIGEEFIPLGGHHDGGADGFIKSAKGKPTTFTQSSKTKDIERKIIETVNRLTEFQRHPKTLIYLTSEVVPNIDQLESSLSDLLSIRIVVRDRNYSVAFINHSDVTIGAFNSYLSPSVAYIREFGNSTFVPPVNPEESRALCVFLGQELERLDSNENLLRAVTDCLIYWALEGTDLNRDIYMSEAQIIEKILEVLPSAKRFIKETVNGRLANLSKKEQSSERRIRRYSKTGGFCLPLGSGPFKGIPLLGEL